VQNLTGEGAFLATGVGAFLAGGWVQNLPSGRVQNLPSLLSSMGFIFKKSYLQ
jgi:hypothetical protein